LSIASNWKVGMVASSVQFSVFGFQFVSVSVHSLNTEN
jgi:hypothetical protein